VGILSYNVFATNEARDELGGQPFDNMDTTYVGSADDAALNGLTAYSVSMLIRPRCWK
jgi:hypothetical protein